MLVKNLKDKKKKDLKDVLSPQNKFLNIIELGRGGYSHLPV